MTTENDIFDYGYNHYNDYAFKSILLDRANGLLKFAEIPYNIKRMMISEVTNLGPSISRLDFVGEAEKDGNSISLILECQTKLPTDEDIKRFFQYVSSIRIFKDCNVELFILCVEKPSYTKKEFVLKDDCVYTMHVISLKVFKAKDIFKNAEDFRIAVFSLIRGSVPEFDIKEQINFMTKNTASFRNNHRSQQQHTGAVGKLLHAATDIFNRMFTYLLTANWTVGLANSGIEHAQVVIYFGGCAYG